MNQTIINKKAHNKKCERMLMLPYSSAFFYYTSLRLRIVLLRSMIIQHCIAILHSAILEKNSKTALIIVQIDLV